MRKLTISQFYGLSLTISQFYGFSPTLTENQQYVVGGEEDGELHLMGEGYPPQIWRVSNPHAKFRVFPVTNSDDMKELASVWHHSSSNHQEILMLYTLKDLGVSLS
jgi:hypothetical protein